MQSQSPRMNVLLVNDHLGYNGTVLHGVGRLFLEWLPIFNSARYNVVTCILKGPDPLNRLFRERGIKIRFLEKRKLNPLTLLRFIGLIRREKIDVMHVQGYAGSTFGRLARILTGVPTLVHYHDSYAESPRIQNVADFIFSRYTDASIAVSKYVKEALVKSRKIHGINQNSIEVIYNCISIDEFRDRYEGKSTLKKFLLEVETDIKIIGCVASLFACKGHKYLLQAMPKIISTCPKVRLVIVGDGPLRLELEKFSKELEIHKYVIFTGFCHNVSEWLAIFDVKVVPSLGDDPPIAMGEGAPIAVLEAMAMGKPIVATNVIEVVEDGITGLLVPPRNSDAIAEKVISLLSNEDLASKLGFNAQEESKKYDVRLYVRKLERIYDDLVFKSKAKKGLRGAIFSR